MNPAARDLESALVTSAEARIAALRASVADRVADLPLRYWRQQAHFTTPADNESMARKAVEGGTAAMPRLMERWRIEPAELADRLETAVDRVTAMLETPRRAPLVMLDGEDATAQREDTLAEARRVASLTLRTAEWGSTLRFYRPPGFGLAGAGADLVAVLLAASTGDPATYPVDGIIFPKVEHPEAVDVLYAILDDVEAALSLPARRIRVGFLVESGWCAAQLPEIARRAAPRLASLIYGLADYSADLGLPEIAIDHPIADWVRAEIVNVAGAVGVPSLDGMTLAFPVADPTLDAAANRERFLERMALCHRDAVRARDLGMTGKWVGHPAQLFATLLAFEAPTGEPALAQAVAALGVYRAAVEQEGRGATMIGGTMADRATDRHARALLRRAVAAGRFDPARAAALGVISADELDDTRSAAG
ncbi:MAG TPA: aldolase/citrate lyase family protein [Candidatus Limnocylindrales bacterium]|nr:aldolase/citrate lyase family protein [Candidatus Limnocylindrales bacterium]